MTHDSYDVEYVCRIIEQKMGRPANEAERRAVAKIGNARDRRRLGQLIQNSSDDVDITRIELPPLPESAKEAQVVDEELDPVAWRHIANLCGKPGTTARPAIPEGGMQPSADFRSVPQQRGQLHAEQQQRHQRISDIAAQRKQKRMEEAQRRSAPMKTNPTGAADPPAQITAE